MINFHAKKEEFIIQEIHVRLIIYNFCEILFFNYSKDIFNIYIFKRGNFMFRDTFKLMAQALIIMGKFFICAFIAGIGIAISMFLTESHPFIALIVGALIVIFSIEFFINWTWDKLFAKKHK